FPHRRLCCPVGSIGNGHLRRPSGWLPLPRSSPVTGRRAPTVFAQPAGPGRASPVPAVTIRTFRAPYAGESFAAALPGSTPLPWPSPYAPGLGTPSPHPTGRRSNDAAGFASRYGPLGCTPSRALDAGLRPRPSPNETASLLPGHLAATRTGLPPASDDEL